MSGDELPHVVVPPPGPRSRALAARLSAVESPAFDARRAAREELSGEDHAAIVYERGEGANVFDADGNRYVDLTAGFGALLLGYGPNAATEAAARAAADLTLALGDVYASEIKVRACEAIAALHPSPGARVMLGLSGADAVTCALKTALLATGKPAVVAFEGSYHGLSYGPLAALGFAPGFREPFAPHLGVPVTFAPYPAAEPELDASLSAVRAMLRRGDAGAILVEPILGRGGCVVPPASFLAELRALATESGALLVVDEIWSGLGRSGAMLASAPVVPDVLCLGKGLGGGLPISACVGSADVMAAWGGHGGTRVHTGTHFGSPPACAAALATLEAIASLRLPARAAELGEAWRSELGDAARGRGLMVGVRLADARAALAASRALLAVGFIVLTGGARGEILTLSPPLTIAPAQLSAFAAALRQGPNG
ncbi:MAG: aminotransferase class III-fold pyridoxal phosphate-dependent enzyme [Labilithrix sp.]|nr:aminotransferase class III-fold pyridoxal phosphate-dependent enzyme [Labilithrix sp.]MCW5818144.1 aminotransferase class III-fold pyridoxal phosphate-dependent enzyme [Labilithrix sp.]